MTVKSLLVIASFANLFFSCNGRSFRYHAHDKVSLAANTVGPFNNPTETYPVKMRKKNQNL
jgi:hypothetical protein